MKDHDHPSLGLIKALPSNLSPKKVWKHLYDPREAWQRLCHDPISLMCHEAEEVLGVKRERLPDLPHLPTERWLALKGLLLQHHDHTYEPIYRSEMSSAEAVWTPHSDLQGRFRALTPRSIFIVVQAEALMSWVVTAFRPHPPIRGVLNEEELKGYGVYYFRKETSLSTDDFKRSVIEGLERAPSAPSTINELWWLALAVGYGRLLRRHAEVQAPLAAAERALAGVSGSSREELRAALDWEGLTGRFAEALKEERSEELERCLAEAEDLLAISEVVDAGPEAETFSAEVEALIPWLPAEWTYIAERARHRAGLAMAEESLVVRLWEAVEEAAAGAILREGPPVTRPHALIVDALLQRRVAPQSPEPGEPLWATLRAQIAQLKTSALGVTSAVESWVAQTIEKLSASRLSPTMSASHDRSSGWVVCGHPASPLTHPAPHYRAFVVDDEYRNGYEVTAQLTHGEGVLWESELGQRALVVIIASERPLEGEGLAQALTQASLRGDVAVDARELGL